MNPKYFVLPSHIGASQVITPKRSEQLLYNTITGKKHSCNTAVFAFLQLATGEKPLQEIAIQLSVQSGESTTEIWPNLLSLTEKMVADGLLMVSDSPYPYRPPPPSVNLIHRLESISFETTHKCNLRCKHCYADANTQRDNELTVPEIKKLIDQSAGMGVLSIIFSGGEPLLHPHIFELMEYARKKPLSVLLFTNGTLITEKVVKNLKKLQVYRVNVSVDGPDAETHDHFRGVKRSFEKTIKGITLLKKANIPVDASISITKYNYTKIPEILQLLKELHINEYKMWPITYSGRPEKEDFFVTCEEFRHAMKADRKFEIENKEEKKEEFYYTTEIANCGIGVGSLTIKSNGVVVPCPMFTQEDSLGNIREDTIIDIWNNAPLLKKVRSMSVFETEPCKTCEFAAVCKGGCIGDIYKRTGEFSCYDPYVCIGFEVCKNDFVPVKVEEGSPSLSVEMV
ncbi:MAG: radical SAM protein [Candidatus Methanofastidiosia archaeon]|jgi:radical SAM protein with 4Fe4S-binding SPASM domain